VFWHRDGMWVRRAGRLPHGPGRAWTVAVVQAWLVSGPGWRVSSGGGGPAAGPGARSRTTAAVAAARAAATAIRVICQPGMPPAAITGTAPAGAAGTGPYGPSPGTGLIAAEAAGTAAAQAGTPPVTAARAAVIRRSHAPALSLWGSEIRFGWVTCAFP